MGPRFHHLLLSQEAAIPAAIVAANLLAPLTAATTSDQVDGGSAAWNFHVEAGNAGTLTWLSKGVRVTRTGSGGGLSGLVLWNQQRGLALPNGTLLSLYIVMRSTDGQSGGFRISSEARNAGYANLGLFADILLTGEFKLYRYDFTLQNYTAGQLNTLPGIYCGTLPSPLEIRDVALVTR